MDTEKKGLEARASRGFRRAGVVLITVLATNVARPSPARAALGTWTTLANTPPIDCLPAALLTDGSVLCERSDATLTPNWYKLKPDSSGGYANGIWSQVASAHTWRLDYPSAILKDGRYWVAGGELGGGNNHGSVEIYDPVADTWAQGPDFPYVDSNGQPLGIFDGSGSVLADGRVLCSSFAGGPSVPSLEWRRIAFIFNPATMTWSDTSHGPGPITHEQGFTLLADGTIFTMGAGGVGTGFIYSPSANAWTQKAAPAGPLMAVGNDEIGAQSLLYSGKILVFGEFIAADGVAHNNVYDPATNTWANNVPDTPASNLPLADTLAVVMPNGHVLTESFGDNATTFLEYDPDANAFTLAPPLPAPETTPSSFPPGLMLPDGQVLVYATPKMLLYTPSGGPQAAWRPSITSVSLVSGRTYQVTGRGLNGVTSGAVEGDDAVFATNYPIAYVVDHVGHVTYLRTTNFSTMAPAVAGTTQLTHFQFVVASGLTHGRYQLFVSASGVSSTGRTVQL